MSASPVFICLVLVEEYGQQQQTTTLMASSPGHGHGHQPASSGIHGGSSPPSLSSGVSSASQDSAICASSSSGAASPLPPPDPGQAPASSCSTFSSTAAFSAASAGHGPTLHLAWMPVDPLLPNPKTEGPQLVLRLNVHNVLEQMRELAHLVAEQYPARPGWLVCSRRAVRQSLYPLCAQALLAKLAAEKGEDQFQQIFSARLPLSALFHRFLPFPMTTNASPANDQRQQQKHQPKNGSPMAEGQQQQQHESSAVVEETLASELQKLVADLLDSPVAQAAKNADDLEFLQPEKWLEPVQQGYRPALCTDVHSLNARVVVRARGLPWQVSDLDVALFFAGLDIARGGIALCLGPEGRRNGECLVRFERPEHRDWALERHRRHLRQRYIEVYRAGADEFVRHAVGTDLCALEFAKRADQPAAAPTATATATTTASSAIEEQQQQQQQAEPGQAMIVRMRGLPFAATEQEIRDFFASDGLPCGIQELGVLFVHRPDGRPSGDAFVLFGDEASGRRALQKHRQRMGIRYIELFRTTQAEVQQLFNARQQAMQLTISSQQQQQQQQQQNAAVAAMAQQQQKTNGVVALQQQQQQGLPMLPFGGQQQQQQQNGTGGGNGGQQQQQQQQQPNIRQRDCLRLRGLPYEAQVQQVVEFMGPHARHVLFQGVHMIYNAAGHPSGEAFIQMESEPAAALAAQECHNKFMELGKKRRYIEVFQCCAEDMSLLLNVMPAAAGAGGNSQPPQATPNGGGAGLLAAPPPPLLPLPVAFTQAGGGGGGVPAPSPLLTFSPAVGPFLTAFGGGAGGDPGAMLMHQFATAPQLAQLYAPEAAIGPGGDFCWLPAGLRNGAAAAAAFPAGLRGAVAAAAAGLPPPVGSFAPTPLLPIHHHTQHQQQQHLLHNHGLINHHNNGNHYQPFVNHHLHMQHHHFGPGPAEMAAATAVKLG